MAVGTVHVVLVIISSDSALQLGRAAAMLRILTVITKMPASDFIRRRVYVFCRPSTGPFHAVGRRIPSNQQGPRTSSPIRPDHAAAGTLVRRQAAEGAGRSRFKFDLRGPVAQVFVFGKPA